MLLLPDEKMPPDCGIFLNYKCDESVLKGNKRMKTAKKLTAIVLASLLLLCGCAPQQQEESFVPESGESSLQEESTQEIGDVREFLRENFPNLDGSTSLIPLEAGIRAEIFGISIEEAQKDVVHSTTWGSFYNLLEGKADMIFSTPISEEQQKAAAEAGVELEQVPVVKEAFVFLVNAKNPVDSLTQQQIKDIYSGKTTNWKELGGNDEPIVAYQRNRDSGSQNYMIDFMGETPLAEAPTELRPGSMGGLMDVIAPNDGSLGSIGYSVYAYAADMYGTGDNIKFIKVDGVAPTKETIISGEYPLSSYNYAIFRADAPEEGAVRRLAEWMTSYDGQLAAAKAGYATVEDIGFDYSQSALKKYEAKGTGIAYPGSVPPYEYDIEFKKECEYEGEKYFRYSDAYTFEQRENGTYNAGFICDKELRREVENFVNEAVKNVSADEENMQNFIDKSASLLVDDPERYGYGIRIMPNGLIAKAEIKNGYLSVYVGLSYCMDVQAGYDRYYRSETAVWDMISGKRLAPEELFYDGVDIAEVINEYLGVETQREEDMFIGSYRMKADFAGLTEGGWHLTADAIYFDNDNPYFAYGYKFSLADLPDDVMVTKQPRAVGTRARMIEESKRFRVINTTTHGVKSDEDFCTYELLYEDSYPGAKKINEFIESYIKENFTEEKVRKYFAGKNVDIDSDNVYFELGGTDFYTTDLGGKYINFSAGELVAIRMDKIDGSYVESKFTYPYSCDVYFDPQTGEQIDSNNVERYS